MGAPIRMVRDNLTEAYRAILENEKRGFEQVGKIGHVTDMNGRKRYVVVMRRGRVE